MDEYSFATREGFFFYTREIFPSTYLFQIAQRGNKIKELMQGTDYICSKGKIKSSIFKGQLMDGMRKNMGRFFRSWGILLSEKVY